jgi:uncharacterized membrane protein YhfC
MDILEIAYIANPVLIFVMAIGLGYFLIRMFQSSWRLFFVGGATYLGAQIVTIILMGSIQGLLQGSAPTLVIQILLTLLLVIVLMGIEEGARYSMYRWWAKDIRSWAGGLVLGAGHGGVEVILLGLMALITIIQLIPLRNVDLTTIFTPDKLEQATEYVNAFWSKSWYNVLAEAIRSALTLPVQLACSLLVLQIFLRQQNYWLFYAIGWHALASIPYSFIDSEKYVYLPLVFLGVVALGSVKIIFQLRPQGEIVN